ncbi:MAG: Maf family protein [Coriobacteriia bacterium]|nr:Maf family protein [Coriobacteriia bacterium]
MSGDVRPAAAGAEPQAAAAAAGAESQLQVILASASPRRTQLLAEAGVAHVVHAVEVDETLEPDLLRNPAEACKKLAERKASASVESYLSDPAHTGTMLFIGADTMVVESGEIFGKPADEADARRMLRRLSGATHQVMTAVSLWLVSAPGAPAAQEAPAAPEASASAGEDLSLYFRTLVDTSNVTFHPLDEAAITDYLTCGESYDKAGAYAVQGEGARLVKRVEGHLDTVIGLPVTRLLQDFPELFGVEERLGGICR